MLTRMLALFFISLIFIDITESMPAIVGASRQLLLGTPGRIPVYIRPGDTPLDEISHDLAEAFNFYAQKNNRITFGRSLDDKPDNVSIGSKLPENIKISESEKASLDTDFDVDVDQDTNNQVNELQNPKDKDKKSESNIQKIPRY